MKVKQGEKRLSSWLLSRHDCPHNYTGTNQPPPPPTCLRVRTQQEEVYRVICRAMPRILSEHNYPPSPPPYTRRAISYRVDRWKIFQTNVDIVKPECLGTIRPNNKWLLLEFINCTGPSQSIVIVPAPDAIFPTPGTRRPTPLVWARHPIPTAGSIEFALQEQLHRVLCSLADDILFGLPACLCTTTTISHGFGENGVGNNTPQHPWSSANQTAWQPQPWQGR